jgi:hypothetical protein
LTRECVLRVTYWMKGNLNTGLYIETIFILQTDFVAFTVER